MSIKVQLGKQVFSLLIPLDAQLALMDLLEESLYGVSKYHPTATILVSIYGHDGGDYVTTIAAVEVYLNSKYTNAGHCAPFSKECCIELHESGVVLLRKFNLHRPYLPK